MKLLSVTDRISLFDVRVEDMPDDRIYPPESMMVLRNFIRTKNLQLLEKPLVLAKKESPLANYMCCMISPFWIYLPVGLIKSLIQPVGMICQSQLARHFNMELDAHTVHLYDARNDFCCHIAKTRKIIPLSKIQAVQESQDCVQTCFGLKVVSILTGVKENQACSFIDTHCYGVKILSEVPVGDGIERAVFLDCPDDVFAAISIAAQLRQASVALARASPNHVNTMGDSGGSHGGHGCHGELAARLHDIRELTARGMLAAADADRLRAPLLAAARDIPRLLLQAADARDAGRLRADELDALRSAFITQLGPA